MLYLAWGLINLSLFIYFIVICFKATKLIRETLGLFAAIVFVFALLSFSGGSNNGNENTNSNQAKTWEFIPKDSLKNSNTADVSVTLEKTLVSSYNLYIQYKYDDEKHLNIPTSASSANLGLIMGTIWQPSSIDVNNTGDANKLRYDVTGTVNWKLLGFTIYSQLKTYAGTVQTKPGAF